MTMVVDAHRLVVMIITRTMMRICISTDMNLLYGAGRVVVVLQCAACG